MRAPDQEVKVGLLRTVSWVLGLGLLLALCYHGWQAWGLGEGYPLSTFLFQPDARFTDYFDVVWASRNFAPYHEIASYFPATYVLVYPLSLVSYGWGMAVLFTLCLALIYSWLKEEFFQSTQNKTVSTAAAACLTLLSYPIIYAVDRGNFELVLLACALGFIRNFLKGNHRWAIACLFPAICMKLYPAALLAVYLRPLRWRLLVSTGLLAFALSIIGLMCFRDGLAFNWRVMRLCQNRYEEFYIVRDCGVAGSPSLWNGLKVLDNKRTFAEADREGKRLSVPAFLERIRGRLELYKIAMLAVCAWTAVMVMFVEKDPRRQCVLLLLFMMFSAPAAGDYKLLYLLPCIACLLGAAEYRSRDKLVVMMLAFSAIPMKYLYIPAIRSSTDLEDAGMNIFIIPLLLLGSFVFLCTDAWAARRARD